MKVFISWSGERAGAVAEALRNWLPKVIQAVKPWVSSEDIRAGNRWTLEIARELEQTKFGIICVTPENQEAPWLLFETGALAKTIENTYVCPYLIELKESGLKRSPLTQFQAMEANEQGTWKLIQAVNRNLESTERLEEMFLKESFMAWWHSLNEKLTNLPEVNHDPEPERSTEEMTEEILELVREMARKQKDTSVQTKFPNALTSTGNFWFLVLAKADSGLKNLLTPPEIKFGKRRHPNYLTTDKYQSYIELHYSKASEFYLEQLILRRDDFHQLIEEVSIATDEWVTVHVLGPNENFTLEVGLPF